MFVTFKTDGTDLNTAMVKEWTRPRGIRAEYWTTQPDSPSAAPSGSWDRPAPTATPTAARVPSEAGNRGACAYLTRLGARLGTFDDGSGARAYSADTYCQVGPSPW
jgi:hypothetical protein